MIVCFNTLLLYVNMEKVIQDKELGTITIRKSIRARHYSLKISDGKIIAIMPQMGNEKLLLSFIEKNRQKLITALQKHPARYVLNEETQLQTLTFFVKITRTKRQNFYMQLNDGILNIACPQYTNFEDENIQEYLRKMIKRALKHEANRILPERLQTLATFHQFRYTEVKINNSHSSWGSCNRRNSINLSCNLMLLPQHLIDYVILHELCHTIELNHSSRFWELLDSVTNNQAKSLRNELKQYHPIKK